MHHFTSFINTQNSKSAIVACLVYHTAIEIGVIHSQQNQSFFTHCMLIEHFNSYSTSKYCIFSFCVIQLFFQSFYSFQDYPSLSGHLGFEIKNFYHQHCFLHCFQLIYLHLSTLSYEHLLAITNSDFLMIVRGWSTPSLLVSNNKRPMQHNATEIDAQVLIPNLTSAHLYIFRTKVLLQLLSLILSVSPQRKLYCSKFEHR